MSELRDVHRGGVPEGEPRSVLALPLVALVRLYQATISPLLGPVCRYYPSCSAYSVTALERYGPLRGTWLTVRRLLRCNPFARGGVDHVPDRTPAPGRGGGGHPDLTTGPPWKATPPVSPAHPIPEGPHGIL